MTNEMAIKYKYDSNDKIIKLFDKKFVENNKANCILVINNEVYELCEFFEINKNSNNNNLNELYIKLIEKKNISNMEYMFYGYNKLI